MRNIVNLLEMCIGEINFQVAVMFLTSFVLV